MKQIKSCVELIYELPDELDGIDIFYSALLFIYDPKNKIISKKVMAVEICSKQNKDE